MTRKKKPDRPRSLEGSASRIGYQPPTREQLQRHIQQGRFADALRLAYGRKLALLQEYLRTFLPDHEHADAIINLMQRRLRRDLNRERTPERDAADYIASLSQWQLELWRRRCGGKLPKGAVKQVVKSVWVRLAEDGELDNTDAKKLDDEFYSFIIKQAGRKKAGRKKTAWPMRKPPSVVG